MDGGRGEVDQRPADLPCSLLRWTHTRLRVNRQLLSHPLFQISGIFMEVGPSGTRNEQRLRSAQPTVIPGAIPPDLAPAWASTQKEFGPGWMTKSWTTGGLAALRAGNPPGPGDRDPAAYEQACQLIT